MRAGRRKSHIMRRTTNAAGSWLAEPSISAARIRAEETQIVRAPALAPADEGGVIGDAAGVRVLEIDAHRQHVAPARLVIDDAAGEIRPRLFV